MTLISMIEDSIQKHADKPALAYKQKGGTYQDISYSDFGDSIEQFSKGLRSLDVQKGDRIAILSENRPEWAISDFSILKVGAINVPMFSTLTAAQVGYILNDSGAKIICVSTMTQLEKVAAIRDTVETLETIILYDSTEDELPDGVASFVDVCDRGKDTETENVDHVSENDIATIIYTSGTTGNPKGVMLTHANFLFNFKACKSLVDVGETDVLLSFLPLSHVFERLGGHYVPLFSGAKIAYAESTFTVAQNMQEVSPSVMLSVPRLYETMHDRVLRAVEAGSSLKQKIFHWGVAVGSKVSSRIQQGQKLSILLSIKRGIANKLVFAKLKAATGGNLRFFISGGAGITAVHRSIFSCSRNIDIGGIWTY